MQHAATSTVIPHIGSSEIHKTDSVAINSDSAKSDARLLTTTENACNVVVGGSSSRLVVKKN